MRKIDASLTPITHHLLDEILAGLIVTAVRRELLKPTIYNGEPSRHLDCMTSNEGRMVKNAPDLAAAIQGAVCVQNEDAFTFRSSRTFGERSLHVKALIRFDCT